MTETICGFVTTISKQCDMRVVIIPKRNHKNIEDYVGKQVKILIKELDY